MSIVGTTTKAQATPRSRRGLVVAALALALAGALGCGTALADGFSYHGQLEQAGEPANGNYDLKLTLYSAEQGGQVIGGPLEISAVAVTEGVFSTDADFGPLANLDDAWLGVEVKAEGGRYEALAGRSKAAAAGEACWMLDGNTGSPYGSYLGNADANDVLIKSGGLTVARFFQNGGVSLRPAMYSSGIGATSVSYSDGANGDYSFAGGWYGTANFPHSFVWNGQDSAPMQFVIGAPGGVGINMTPTAPVPNFHVAELSIKSNATGNAGNKDISMIRLVSGTDKAANLSVNKDGEVSLSPGDLAGNTSLGRLAGSGTIFMANNSGIRRVPSANAFEVQGNASKSTAGSWLANSDGRVKQDIQPIDNALDILARIKPVTFRYTDSYRANNDSIVDHRYYNVIAQEFAEVFPDAVQGSGEYLPGAKKTANNEILQVDTYPALITTMAAVQELAAENAELKAQLAALNKRMDTLATQAGR